MRANGRPVREVKEQEAVRVGKTKCYQVSISGAGLPSCLSPRHRPRAAWEATLTVAGANPDRCHSYALLEPGAGV